MQKLFLDIGNTRVKIAVLDEGAYRHIGAFALSSFLDADDSFKQLADTLHIDEVFISSVASIEVLEEIKAAILNAWGVFSIVLTAQQACCNLTSGYDVFHQLGVDRWMALQGAMELVNEPFIVIDAGTAMTVDAVADGLHLGGFIVPGLTSLRQALAKDASALTLVDTSSIQELEDKNVDTLLATNTNSAILGGTLYMSAAFINTFVSDLNQQLTSQFNVVLTGGDAQTLLPLIDFKTLVVSDLVLKGMVSIQKHKKSQNKSKKS